MGWILAGILLLAALGTRVGQELLNAVKGEMTISEIRNKWAGIVGQVLISKSKSLPVDLILAVIRVESSGNPAAHNKGSGATGLMQITQPALTDFNKAMGTTFVLADLYRPELNLEVGIWYLSWLLNAFGEGTTSNLSLSAILQAYNWGIGNVLAKKTPVPAEAVQYPYKVMDSYYVFNQLA